MNKAGFACFPLALMLGCISTLLFGTTATVSNRVAIPTVTSLGGDFWLTPTNLAFPTPFAVTEAPTVDFEQRDAEIAATAQAFGEGRTTPIDILFLVDVSGSMAQENRLEQVKFAIDGLADSLLPEDNVGLVIFNDDVFELLTLNPFSEAESLFRQQVASLYPDGGTELFAAVQFAFELMSENGNPDRLRVIVLISDGADTGTRGFTLNDALTTINAAQAEANPIKLIPIGYGMDADFLTLNQFATASITRLFTAFPEDIAQVLLVVHGDIRSLAEAQ